MKLRQLVFRSMLKNMKHYYLYFFSLIFSVTLYFSFKTLRFNEEVTGQLREGSTASSGFEVATYLLYFIILVFVLYANHLFMRRRSKEIGLYQLIGMTKGLVFRLLAIENLLLFSGAVIIGIIIGFLTSRFFAMILLKLIGESFVLTLSFNVEAAVATLTIFAVMLVIILVQLFVIIQRQSLLQMFHAANQADESIRKFSIWHMAMGLFGLLTIAYGYKASTTLFEGEGGTLVFRMLEVLATTILGTYLTFRYAVALLINTWRQRQQGYLSRTAIIAFMPIMHRMKSSASSLTLITVLTAVSLGINTLAYITYYSIEKMAVQAVPADYVSILEKETKNFMMALDEEAIAYTYEDNRYMTAYVDFAQLLVHPNEANSLKYEINEESRIVKGSFYGETLHDDEALVMNFNGYSTKLLDFKEGTVQLDGNHGVLHIQGYNEQSVLTTPRTLATGPVILVSDDKYEAMESSGDYYTLTSEYHISLHDAQDAPKADVLYEATGANVRINNGQDGHIIFLAQHQLVKEQMFGMGLTIFITAFLGLAFLLASGSILYFKQMSEADLESNSYTILRKIGYSEQDIMHAVYWKQLFNFGVPVVIGLCHSYFAVKSGWWFFGMEFQTPLMTMMVMYIVLYALFAVITICYYRTVVRRSF